MQFPKPIKAIWDFALRVVTGIALFIGVGLAATALNFITTYGGVHHLLPAYMLLTMEVLAYVIFGLDVTVVLVFLGKEELTFGSFRRISNRDRILVT